MYVGYYNSGYHIIYTRTEAQASISLLRSRDPASKRDWPILIETSVNELKYLPLYSYQQAE